VSGPRMWPARGPNQDVEEYADELVRILREQGPLNTAALRERAQSRYWGPGCFGAAVQRAREQGRIRRAGFRTYAAT
jgi:hypothetical protein